MDKSISKENLLLLPSPSHGIKHVEPAARLGGENGVYYICSDLFGLGLLSKLNELVSRIFRGISILGFFAGLSNISKGINEIRDEQTLKGRVCILRGISEIAAAGTRIASEIVQTAAKTATVSSKYLAGIGSVFSIASLSFLSMWCFIDNHTIDLCKRDITALIEIVSDSVLEAAEGKAKLTEAQTKLLKAFEEEAELDGLGEVGAAVEILITAIPLKILKKSLNKSINEINTKLKKVGVEDTVETIGLQTGLQTALNNLESKKRYNMAVIAICVASIAATILGIVFTGGIGPLIASIIASVTMTGLDLHSFIKDLKNATHISNGEIARNILMAVLGAVALGLSVYFAPTVAVAIAGAAIGTLITAIPLVATGVKYHKMREIQLEAATRIQATFRGKDVRTKAKRLEAAEKAEAEDLEGLAEYCGVSIDDLHQYTEETRDHL